jgi:hypothetical protein
MFADSSKKRLTERLAIPRTVAHLRRPPHRGSVPVGSDYGLLAGSDFGARRQDGLPNLLSLRKKPGSPNRYVPTDPSVSGAALPSP